MNEYFPGKSKARINHALSILHNLREMSPVSESCYWHQAIDDVRELILLMADAGDSHSTWMQSQGSPWDLVVEATPNNDCVVPVEIENAMKKNTPVRLYVANYNKAVK